ncbi:hypothetical protein ABZ354_15815 [Streptomyces sp. NPDC005925]|uniref:hypothetical protein n=1 Tax=Streptomyces sp. NPDC005925 TaxID=3157172 RepID=UPI0033C19A03
MHMNSVPQHLLSEDRQEYERLLDEALRSAPHRPDPAAGLTPEQLRTMALGATAFITAAAATEYQHYIKVREELRRPVPSASSSGRDSGSAESGSAGVGPNTAMGDVAETTGAGAAAVVAVLAPVLAGTAAAIFLLVGYLLKMLTPEPAFARTMLTTGWVFGALTAIAILVAAAGLLLTALRNRPPDDAGLYGAPDAEVTRAREAWLAALLERGVLPFLQEALTDPGSTTVPRGTAPPAPTSRMPRLGYDRPGFSSPGDDGTGRRPRFSSPDYTSPDFGGPDHQPE